MGKKWMPITVGVLDILSCASGIIFGIFLLQAGPRFDPWHSTVYEIGGPLISVIGVLAIVGGVFSFKRMRWPLALSGAIAAFIVLTPLMWEYWWYFDPRILSRYFFSTMTLQGFSGIPAIVAIILTVLSRKQFERK